MERLQHIRNLENLIVATKLDHVGSSCCPFSCVVQCVDGRSVVDFTVAIVAEMKINWSGALC